jgi:peroxiredoxin Q/BCP
MAQLRQDFTRFQEENTIILVVGPESAAAFASYWAKNNLPFIGLPDPEQDVLIRYGQENKLFKLGRMPAMIIIDKSGKVRFSHYGNSMRDIPENKEILAILHTINQNRTNS